MSEGEFHDTPKSLYKQQYYEAIDLLINCIEDRFDQPGYKVYHSVETLLLKACKLQEYESCLEAVCNFYQDDFDKDVLRTQLQTFGVHFQQVQDESLGATYNIFDIKKYFLTLSPGKLSLLSNVKLLMQLILVMPATNACSERSFSALRRIKTYLRATMKQDRLNYLMLLHVHKSVINEFIGSSDHRSNIFVKL